MGKAVRLDKYLADAGLGTRSEVKKMILKGMVQIDGQTERHPETKVIPGETVILYQNDPVETSPEYVYYLLNKPAGCVSATEDLREKTVMEYVPDDRKGLFPVGRLDKDTEGLLLITDDGHLAHRLLSPRRHVDKTYYVKVFGILTEEEITAIENGLDIGDEKDTLPARLVLLRADRETQTCEIHLTIQEGRYHQVKRMLEAVGKRVRYLKRLSMGPLVLPADLEPGQARPLTEEEITSLKMI